MKNKINWKSAFTVMGAILAFNIGTGFATGQEVMQYFSVFGWWSIGAGLAFAVTMAIGIYCFAYASERFGLTNGEQVLKYYLGNGLGTVINYFYVFYLYMCVIVMYSGAASALNEQYGAPLWVGAAIIAGICCITSLFGLKNIVNNAGARCQGIGWALLTHGLRVCYEGGARVSFLEVRAGNVPAIHLYEKAGYHTEGIRKQYYQDNHEDALMMNLDPEAYEKAVKD